MSTRRPHLLPEPNGQGGPGAAPAGGAAGEGGDRPLSRRARPVVAARALTTPSGRRSSGRFLVEGPQAVTAAWEAGQLEELFATRAAAARYAHLPVDHVVDEAALASITDSVTPQGLVGIAPLVGRTVTDADDVRRLAGPGRGRLVIVLVQPRDPGNVGAIIRTADAAGADAVVLAGSAVDVHNGKVVRASAGSLFHLPVILAADVGLGLELVRGAGLTLLAATGEGATPLPTVEAAGRLALPTAWVFGTEADGLAAEVVARCDEAVRIPMRGRAESLNLAAAAAVCIYASVRAQRWQTPDA